MSITLDHQPERFTLDPRLAEVLGLEYGTKARILQAFWGNIKRHRLQDPQHPQQIILPMELAQVHWGGTKRTCVVYLHQRYTTVYLLGADLPEGRARAQGGETRNQW